MQTIRSIDIFIDELVSQLNLPFTRKDTESHISIDFYTLNFILLIYLETQTTRFSFPNSRAIHIDIDLVLSSSTKIIRRLCSLLGRGNVIYARETIVARIDKKASLDFQTEHHLQTSLPGKYRYGLYLNGELISIAVFSGGRRMNNRPTDYRSYELLRFCHKSGYRVVGGLSKLIKSFQKDFTPGDIMTYVDTDWSQDSNLQTLGFVETGETEPQSFWISGLTRIHISNTEQLTKLQSEYPNGYIKKNSGSKKLVITL